MLTRIIDLSLRYRVAVFVAAGLLAVAGLASLAELPFDAFPDTTPVQVSVNAVAPSLSPLEVERQITFPLEQAIGGLPGLTQVRSISKFGFSQITAIFDDSIDVYLARQVVSERLQSVELPPGVGRPSLGPVSTGLGEVFQYVLRSDELSATELRTLHHWVVRPQMLQVPGVAEINTWGGYEKQYHVVIDPDRLVQFGLTLDDVARALRRNNANAGGGLLDRGGEAQIIQGVALATGIEDIRRIVVVARDGVPILVGDVARVREGHEIRRGAVTAQGQGEAVLGLGFMLIGENSRDLTRKLEQRLADVAEGLPPEAEIQTVYSRTDLVDRVLRTVRNNLLEGALLVVAVLFIFLGNLRAGLIVAAAIPLSMLFAFNGMLRFGIAGSLMSLGAIDFGLVVDSSVIMVENASRHLSEATDDRSVRAIVRDAAIEVRKPTLFGELIIAIVYLPILALEGIEGKLFRPMALTVIFALAASMLLSLTLMPALASLALKKGGHGGETRVIRWLKRAYRPVLRLALRNEVVVLGLAALVLAGAAFLGTRLGSEFIPRLREMAITINTVRLAGVSLAESVRYGTQIENLLLEQFPDEIAHVWTRTGTAEVATDPMGLEVSDVFLTLTPRKQWTRARTQDQLVDSMSAALEGMPGMRAIFTQPIEMRMNEMIAGVRADVGIKLFGDDFDILREKANEIRRVVEATPGAADVTVEQLTGAPVLQITVDREAIARFGVPAQEVLEIVESMGTRKVGEIVEGQRRFDLAIRLDDRYLDDPAALGKILLPTPGGERLPLERLADLHIVEGPSTINREWAKRRIIVQSNVRDRDVGSFVAEIRSNIAETVELPPGYYVGYGGQFEHLERARLRLAVVVPLALLLIFVLLYFSLGGAMDAWLVFTGVPFAAVGGIVALWARGLPFTISAGVGFVALFGVSVLGQLVLVSRIQQLTNRGAGLRAAIAEAAETRLRPVLMTGLVASLGFLPMALNTGVGAEVQRPLATVLIGGVITSMLATLLVLPVLYARFGAGGGVEIEARGVVVESGSTSRRDTMTKRGVALTIACVLLGAAAATTSSAAPKTDQIRIRYVPPKNPEHRIIYDDLQERRVLEKLREFLSPFRLPRTLKIKLAGCDGEADAFYGNNVITICYEYVEALWNNMPEETTPAGVAPIDTVVGPFLDTCLHEFAHALFDLLNLPVLGREEDAADQVAAYIYLHLGPVESRRLILGTAYTFLSEAARERAPSMADFAGEHGTPAQRGYNVLCIAYGADEKLFGDVVRGGYLPKERAEYCWEEYEQVQDAYDMLVGPHIDQALAENIFERSWLR